jgi:hypothetical protein
MPGDAKVRGMLLADMLGDPGQDHAGGADRGLAGRAAWATGFKLPAWKAITAGAPVSWVNVAIVAKPSPMRIGPVCVP